jgi:hypothetical protein
MHKLEALQILKIRLAAIEQERRAECAVSGEAREPIDVKARALAAVLYFGRPTSVIFNRQRRSGLL